MTSYTVIALEFFKKHILFDGGRYLIQYNAIQKLKKKEEKKTQLCERVM